MKIMKIVLFLLLAGTTSLFSQEQPKREFRGAWIHTVGNEYFKTVPADSIKALFIRTLDEFERTGINAVIFQVRPQADAFYISNLEPWSRFLTGNQGIAPNPVWDPLQFMIEECHKRGMELHAWLNPYRVTSNDQEQLHPDHLYFKKPELFKRYGKQLYFDPGEPEAIEHTVKVVADIVSRYDVDAIHFDDYFYPYPVQFEEFHDDASFVKYAASQGFEYWQKADWRRNNVNTLIHKINDTIKHIKPWVRFGISPFGIHRNLKDTPDGSGSKTNGLSTYEALYADIPLWLQKGWIDYNAPQLYWEIGHAVADYKTLIEWWNEKAYPGQLYIGQNISSLNKKSTTNPERIQLGEKMEMMRNSKNVNGNIWWPGWSIPKNPFGFADSLANKYQSHPAIIPAYKALDSIAPAPVEKLRKKGNSLVWEHNANGDKMQEAQFFAIYRFPAGITPDFNSNTYLLRLVNNNSYPLDTNKKGKKKSWTYYVTAIDRCRNESIPCKGINVKE
jgi:uncharacterized lipoprotein YddW (UPF0748 family)